MQYVCELVELLFHVRQVQDQRILRPQILLVGGVDLLEGLKLNAMNSANELR